MTSGAAKPRSKNMAPWRGRKRVKDARTKLIPAIRCTEEERVAIRAAADQAGLSVGAFVRALALGNAGPRAVRLVQCQLTALVDRLHAGRVQQRVESVVERPLALDPFSLADVKPL